MYITCGLYQKSFDTTLTNKFSSDVIVKYFVEFKAGIDEMCGLQYLHK